MPTVLVSPEGVLDPDSPIVHADDLGVVHGDGLFETMLVRAGRACGRQRHLDRMAASAVSAGLPAVDVAVVDQMLDTALDQWRRVASDGEGMLRVVLTRGREHDVAGHPTTFVTIDPVPERVTAVRREGLRAVTLPTAYEPGLAARAPWLLSGVKSLSYAMNLAALAHVRTLGVDDAIFTSSAGTVLEGPRGSVIAVIDGALVTPVRDDGILPGTTQDALFELASAEGIGVAERALSVDELYSAQEVWLVSSVTLAARVTELDGRKFPGQNVIEVADLVERSVGS